ncbi:hypothetical protein M407DRAFT_31421 [Tulasnella calospora MUT 4182]|uniref:F-box domain-containing protein n=1 Tax=Tulasnella calospora MUT 4182 TaxID=1051891 RepID=A0A0C3KBV5_9AGAM|nr:hypothetical protein M407DRAFT_31421 [Tulasnella calospora MUT 4182]
MLEIARKDVLLEAPFLQLPPKVIILITDRMDLAEKARLLVTCQYLRQLLEPVLYQHLKPNAFWKARLRLRLFRTLEERKHLLLYIHSFHGLLVPTLASEPYQSIEQVQPTRSGVNKSIEDQWLERAAPLFAQATNIRDLEFTDYIQWEAKGRFEFFKSIVSNMKLRRLVFLSCSDRCLDFTPVLRGQPELTELVLHCSTSQFEGLEETAVPKLNFFHGTMSQAAAIVPGRPVERLDLSCPSQLHCQCFDEDIYRKLLQSSKAIHALGIRSHSYFDEPTLRGAVRLGVRYLPRIVDLKIVTEGSLSAQLLLEEIPKFSSIGSLMLFTASLQFPDAPIWPPCRRFSIKKIQTFEGFSAKLKKKCPSLNEVTYTQLERDGRGDIPILPHENLEDYL